MISRLLYTCFLHLLLPSILLRLAWRGRKLPAYRERWQERLGLVTPLNTPTQPLWIHAVSVGEVQAVSTLVERLLKNKPDLPILITTMTPTGTDRVKQLFGDRVNHRYCPYDLPWALKRFLKTLNPKACLIVETELWPNFLNQCQTAKIPVLLANARLSERSARGYARFPNLTKSMLQKITHLAAQGEADAMRFKDLGMNPANLSVTGSIKFDVAIQPAWSIRANELKEHWGAERPVLLAASTHNDEEMQLLKAFPLLLERYPNALLILAPRHPERFSEVAQLCESSGLVFARRSLNSTLTNDTRIYLADTMGELMMFCSAADIVFVGGSLIERGGHNPLEPALLAKPVLCGPYTYNFAAITLGLVEAGALIQLDSGSAIMQQTQRWLDNRDSLKLAGQAAQHYVAQHSGALQRLEAQLEKFI